MAYLSEEILRHTPHSQLRGRLAFRPCKQVLLVRLELYGAPAHVKKEPYPTGMHLPHNQRPHIGLNCLDWPGTGWLKNLTKCTAISSQCGGSYQSPTRGSVWSLRVNEQPGTTPHLVGAFAGDR